MKIKLANINELCIVTRAGQRYFEMYRPLPLCALNGAGASYCYTHYIKMYFNVAALHFTVAAGSAATMVKIIGNL